MQYSWMDYAHGMKQHWKPKNHVMIPSMKYFRVQGLRCRTSGPTRRVPVLLQNTTPLDERIGLDNLTFATSPRPSIVNFPANVADVCG